MKEQYTAPELEIIRFETEDVITTSDNRTDILDFSEESSSYSD